MSVGYRKVAGMTASLPSQMPCGCMCVVGYRGDPLAATVTGRYPTCTRHLSGDTLPVQVHRVIVTGSRKWADDNLVYADLEYQLTYAQSIGAVLVVRHGKNPRGADAAAAAWAKWARPRGVVEDPVPADWGRDCTALCTHRPRTRADGSTYCPAAGNLRNQNMVDKGADICLAYPLDGTGTQDCMKRAAAAGIPTYDRAAG